MDSPQILSANTIYQRLCNETLVGKISFDMGGTQIVVKKKDVVGNILQEWVEGWLAKNNIVHKSNPNTQMPPDIFLNPNDTVHNLLEIKAFNFASSPAFDVADFKSFVTHLLEYPYTLDVDYLIFGYEMDQKSGNVTVQHLWLKKIWEIISPMEGWPITLQYKNGKVHKIRPGNWYAKKKKFPIFTCKEHFISAFDQAIYENPDTRNMKFKLKSGSTTSWRNCFINNFNNFYKNKIKLPRWDDIKSQYNL